MVVQLSACARQPNITYCYAAPLSNHAPRRMPAAPASSVREPARIRLARAALLDARATALLEVVQDVLCEHTRSQIVRALATSPLSVGDLSRVIGRGKSVTSRHLRILREIGIVSPRRRGRLVYYSLIASPAVESALGALNLVAQKSADG